MTNLSFQLENTLNPLQNILKERFKVSKLHEDVLQLLNIIFIFEQIYLLF